MPLLTGRKRPGQIEVDSEIVQQVADGLLVQWLVGINVLFRDQSGDHLVDVLRLNQDSTGPIQNEACVGVVFLLIVGPLNIRPGHDKEQEVALENDQDRPAGTAVTHDGEPTLTARLV